MINIAIDGPSGAGKSTVAKLLSKELGILYLDTGALYRAIGLKIYRAGVLSTDVIGIESILPSTNVDIEYINGNQVVYLDGQNVTSDIREHVISKYASDVSALKSVRELLLDIQRGLASKYDCVLDGRDIGTCVLPNAQVKVFLTASIEERARRRQLELSLKGTNIEYQQVFKDIQERDRNDSTRAIAPLSKATDAVLIDSTNLTINEVCNQVIDLINSKCTTEYKHIDG